MNKLVAQSKMCTKNVGQIMEFKIYHNDEFQHGIGYYDVFEFSTFPECSDTGTDTTVRIYGIEVQDLVNLRDSISQLIQKLT